jgi:hypothetical protein
MKMWMSRRNRIGKRAALDCRRFEELVFGEQSFRVGEFFFRRCQVLYFQSWWCKDLTHQRKASSAVHRLQIDNFSRFFRQPILNRRVEGGEIKLSREKW